MYFYFMHLSIILHTLLIINILRVMNKIIYHKKEFISRIELRSITGEKEIGSIKGISICL
jgi:hypothetical protein